jgi:hypothetical protein
MNDALAKPHIDDKATCGALNEIVSAYLDGKKLRVQRPVLCIIFCSTISGLG